MALAIKRATSSSLRRWRTWGSTGCARALGRTQRERWDGDNLTLDGCVELAREGQGELVGIAALDLRMHPHHGTVDGALAVMRWVVRTAPWMYHAVPWRTQMM